MKKGLKPFPVNSQPKLPSQFQPSDYVTVDLGENQKFKGTICKVAFTHSKVLYDVEVEIIVPESGNIESDKGIYYTRLHSIDSVFVKK